MKETTEYLIERTLQKRNPQLHRQFTDTVFALQRILANFLLMFPNYTDHTELHCLSVVEFCNKLIGTEQIKRMNEDELYVLLQASYLHDVGMGISRKDYEQFLPRLDTADYLRAHPNADIPDIVRDFHHELSGLFIEKYAALFDVPSPEHLFAVKQVARGHRRTDLFDEKEYPAAWKLPNGNTVCLPYLAALIRLADEIDVVALRNPKLLYDMEALTNAVSIMEFRKHDAIRALEITDDAFVMVVSAEDAGLLAALEELRAKMQKTLDYCRKVTQQRSPYEIRQKTVAIRHIS